MLCNADYYGTLAATRSLGQHGVPVYVAAPRRMAASSWSFYATRSLRAPGLEEPERFTRWLLELGEREPGMVLYPTSDEATFLYARALPDLSKHYRMYQPELDVVLHVLDKKRLYESARAVGLEVPETWFPSDEAEVARLASEVPLPVLIKPRTQVLSNTHSKGVIIRERGQLLPRYRAFTGFNTHAPVVTEHLAEASRPMLQRYIAEAAEQIYSLACFVDRSGQHFAARGSVKVFQRPRSLGIGLCFESAPLEVELAEKVRALAQRTGYFGLFQLEFIRVGGRHLLIDFNPRFYNQLAFDVARGLPLPMLVHAAARGDEAEVARLVAEANRSEQVGPSAFCNRLGLRMMLSTQRIAGRMSSNDVARWKGWVERHRDASVDPSLSGGDLVPALVDVASQLYSHARHPRAFLRNVVLDRTG